MIGSQLNQFNITDKLGEGGMGAVYRAEDTKLGRQVAIKVLPSGFTADPERLARFEREAKLLASLNHPGIAGIHDFAKSEGNHFLVLELVEGQDLGERLKAGRIPVDEALPLALQIAEALEAAHARGIVHRDLKPANVKTTPEGKVKVLDFGLAKAFETVPEGADAMATQSPTLTAQMTGAGVILGTAAYMSPEQARGQEADKRSDIWSFGVMLFEMLTGEGTFREPTVSDTLAAVLRADLEWHKLPADLPRAARRLLERCLQRDPDQRLHDIADARLEIQEAIERGPEEVVDSVVGAPAKASWLWKAAALLFLLTTFAALGYAILPRSELRVVKAQIPAPRDMDFHLSAVAPGPAVLSPDGRQVAFVATANAGDQPMLWVRSLDAVSGRALPGTENAQYPFWSPDGRYLAFDNGTHLKKIAVAGGPPVTLCESSSGKGGSWSPTGQIVFSPDYQGELLVVSSAGGETRPVTEAGEGSNSHRHPRFLPDGNRFLYVRRDGADGQPALWVGSVDGSLDRMLMPTDGNAEFASGHLLFPRSSTLMAQPFDPDSLELSGEARPLAENLWYEGGAVLAIFSASNEGTLVYQTAATAGASRMVWRDRKGEELGGVGEDGTVSSGRISPDGSMVAFESTEDGRSDIWIHELARDVRTRFTFDPASDWGPLWSADSSELIFVSNRNGSTDLFRKSVDGSGQAELLLSTGGALHATDWSEDGNLVLYHQWGAANVDVWLLDIRTGEIEALLDSEFVEVGASLSPDERWIAYSSFESGEPQVFVTSFPEPGRKWQVSGPGGGNYAGWGPDGREIIYRTRDALWSVEVDGTGDTLVIGKITRLFDLRPMASSAIDWHISPDGQRFLLNERSEGGGHHPLTLVLNWPQELKN